MVDGGGGGSVAKQLSMEIIAQTFLRWLSAACNEGEAGGCGGRGRTTRKRNYYCLDVVRRLSVAYNEGKTDGCYGK